MELGTSLCIQLGRLAVSFGLASLAPFKRSRINETTPRFLRSKMDNPPNAGNVTSTRRKSSIFPSFLRSNANSKEVLTGSDSFSVDHDPVPNAEFYGLYQFEFQVTGLQLESGRTQNTQILTGLLPQQRTQPAVASPGRPSMTSKIRLR